MSEGWEVRDNKTYLEQPREGQYCCTIDCEVEVAAE